MMAPTTATIMLQMFRPVTPSMPNALNKNPPTIAPTMPKAMSSQKPLAALIDNLAANKPCNETQNKPADNSHGFLLQPVLRLYPSSGRSNVIISMSVLMIQYKVLSFGVGATKFRSARAVAVPI